MTDEFEVNDSPAAPAAGEKLQKVLARMGLGSRREVEGWIAAGRVSVNGQRAELGCRVDSMDQISVDDRPLRRDLSTEVVRRVMLYNKPEGEVCTRDDPEGRPTVFDRLPRSSTAAGSMSAVSISTPAVCCCSPLTVSWQTG